jgi:hypothetical protein
MSAGPIKAQREAFGKREPVSTPDAHRVCAAGEPGRGYCGRKADAKTTKDWAQVVCSDCEAARRADEDAGRGR